MDLLADDINGDVTSTLSGSHNLSRLSFLVVPADTILGDPQLQPLADNGGPTQTHALLAGSPAIDAGNNPASDTIDQRGPGFFRQQGGASDIGAFEYAPFVPIPPTVAKSFAPATIFANAVSTLTITRGNANAVPATLAAALTDTFPTSMVVASSPNASTNCLAGSVTADPGSSSVSLAATAKIPPAGSCSVSVEVTVASPGVFTNMIAAGGLQTDAGHNADAATADLTVSAVPIAPTPALALVARSPTERSQLLKNGRNEAFRDDQLRIMVDDEDLRRASATIDSTSTRTVQAVRSPPPESESMNHRTACGIACLALIAPLATAQSPANASTPVVANYAPLALTAADASEDIALLRRAMELIHPGLYRYTSHRDIDAAFGRLEQAASQPTNDLALWRETALMSAQIHCDHTKPEASTAIENYRTTQPTHLPFRFAIVEGRMIVVSNDGSAGAPPPFAEIVGINGIPAPVALATLGRAVAYDGTTDQAIAAKLGSDSDLMGDDFNEYWPAFYGFAQQWTLDWKNSDDSQVSHSTLAPISFDRWKTLRWPGSPYRDEFYKSVTWRVAGKAAYLRIDTFVNYRNPVDATAFLGGFFKTLHERPVDHLILDLRENGGGSEDVSVALGRYLLADTFVWSKPVLLKAVRYGDLPSHIDSWGDPKELFEPALEEFRKTADGWYERIPRAGNDDDESVLPQTVSPDRFRGRVTVLTGAMNGSGATRTIAQLKEKIGARIVGEDSAGSAEGPTSGHIFLLTLPHSGLKVRIASAWNRTNVDHFIPSRGVPADELVTPTVADLHLGKDATLDVAKAAQPSSVPLLESALHGSWTGHLDYRDFGNDQRVVLPLEARSSGKGNRMDMHFTIDDGPGKTVHASGRWAISANGKILMLGEGKDRETQQVVERRGGSDDDFTLIADGHGIENDRPVLVRTALVRRGNRLSITRQTRIAGEPFLMRHVYELQSVPERPFQKSE